MASSEQIETLLRTFNEITEVEIDDLIYDKDWGSINFEAAKPDLERLYSLCNHFKVLPLNHLPEDIATQINNEISPAFQTVTNIREFKIEQENPSAIMDQYVKAVTTGVDKFYKFSHIYAPYLAYLYPVNTMWTK